MYVGEISLRGSDVMDNISLLVILSLKRRRKDFDQKLHEKFDLRCENLLEK